jgi:cardiolipin synthase
MATKAMSKMQSVGEVRTRSKADLSSYSLEPGRLSSGNSLELLIDGGETFPAMLAAIAGATRFVHLETYILADDEIGRRFAGAMLERARAGVTIRLLFDSLGSFRLSSSYVRKLVDAGIDVIECRPIRKFIRGHWFRRDHRKILVVDGRIGFTGGLNISKDYASGGRESGGWRDTHVRALGPVVAELEALFRANWHRSHGTPYPAYVNGRDDFVGHERGLLAAVIASDGGRRSVIRRHYLHAFVSARTSIYLANAYFVPDHGLVRALRRAARRGVHVAILVPSESDVAVVQWASEYLFDRLLRKGVELYLWPKTHMHAKTAVVDGTWSVVGSYNLDSASLSLNQEVVIECVDETFGARMVEQFDEDRKACPRLDLSEWRQRPAWRRLTEWLAYQMKRCL